METADGFEVIKYIPCPSLPYDKPGACYTVCALPDDPVSGKLHVNLLYNKHLKSSYTIKQASVVLGAHDQTDQ